MNKRLTLVSASLLALSVGFFPAASQAALPMSAQGQALPSLAPMLEKVTPAVVSISVAGTHVSKRRVPDAFRYFFGPNTPREQVKEQPFQGLGSGVIIDADEGYIITNHHVINNAQDIQVTLSDGRQLEAKLLGSDPNSDVALLQVKADNLTAVKKADSDQLRVGDFTVAIGNPFGLGQTVTSGIVSALGRSGLNLENLENFIQTDAAINSGNSGGALVNLNGELIGINTAIYGPNGGNVGIGFAIPVNMVSNLATQIIEYGEVRRGVLGVSGQELTAELAESFNYSTKHGAFVNEVMPNSAAEEGGLEAGDIIIKVNGRAIKSFQELRAKIATQGAGSKVKLVVIRDGREKELMVKLREAASENIQARVIHPALEGATLSTTGDEDRFEGVKVDELAANSPAARLGLQAEDIIVGINRQRIDSLKELRSHLEDDDGVAALQIRRGKQKLYLILR